MAEQKQNPETIYKFLETDDSGQSIRGALTMRDHAEHEERVRQYARQQEQLRLRAFELAMERLHGGVRPSLEHLLEDARQIYSFIAGTPQDT